MKSNIGWKAGADHDRPPLDIFWKMFELEVTIFVVSCC